MRVFYIFEVKPEFKYLYSTHQSALYGILKQLYYLGEEDLSYGFNLFQQLTTPIDKEKMDRLLFLQLHQDIPYSKREGKHRINNLYKDEISILEVKHSYIKIKAEQESSSFFSVLSTLSKNFFVCDFYFQDYFFLDEEKNLV